MDYKNLQFVLAGPGHSGSTWLGHMLRQTPDIFVTHEINYLTWTKSTFDLGHFFTEAAGRTVLGEHSNNYFSWDGIPEQLHKLNGSLKIVIMVRDPVKKLVSNYLHDIRWGILPRYVTLRIAILPNYFERRYIHDSDYPLNIKRWLDFFPAENIYLFRSPADTNAYDQVPNLIGFLGGKSHAISPKRVMNEAKLPLLPQLHRHATFGKQGITKTICRALDSLNVRAGRWLGDQVTDDDIKAVTNALGERASLAQLAKIAEKTGINGFKWITAEDDESNDREYLPLGRSTRHSGAL